MGWVTEISREGQEVRGIIVASGFKDRLKYAVDAMPNVLLKRYAVNFLLLMNSKDPLMFLQNNHPTST